MEAMTAGIADNGQKYVVGPNEYGGFWSVSMEEIQNPPEIVVLLGKLMARKIEIDLNNEIYDKYRSLGRT